MTTVVRARLAHVPRDPFAYEDALEAFDDGAVAFADGRVLATGAYTEVRARHPNAELVDASDAILLPGFVDTHVHYPQLGVVGAMGLELLDWLALRTLPEEARLAEATRARSVANTFVRALAANGTTTALVFGSHYPQAQEALFAEAERRGLRIVSGLVVSDRNLRPELELTPDEAHDRSLELIERWHGRGRLRYAVAPRFAVSCSEAMLERCGALLRAVPDLSFTTHLNESRDEIAFVRQLFPWASDYLGTYERYGLVGARSVLAHNVHPTDGELERLGAAGACVAHCPSSNAFLGSGIFPLRRHRRHGVRFALGSDVGAGPGLSLLKEGLAGYQMQMLSRDQCRLTPAQILYLATRAGADALGFADEVGDLRPGASADFVLLRAPSGSSLETLLSGNPSWEATLGALFSLAREESVVQVRVAGETVFDRTAVAGPAPRARTVAPQ